MIMAPIVKKRFRSNKSQISRKKIKTDTSNHELQKGISDSKAIALDELPWFAVSPPDRLDNAEGFYGLEEIADVEIVRDLKAGKIECRVGKNYYDKAHQVL